MSIAIDLTGRTALVTGASRGIGREIALTLSRAGACVGCVATNETLLAEVVSACGPNAAGFKADVSKAAEVDAAVSGVVGKFGGLDIVVNNAGITRDNLLIRMKEEEWDAVLDVNLKGAFNVMKAASRPLMRSKSGRIINIASVAGLAGNPGQANYSASKGGLIALSKTAAREYGSRAICVNAVAPGFIRTDMVAKVDPKLVEAAVNAIPFRRMGEAGEVAAVVLFLASDLGSYITGQVLVVDGGMVM